MTTSSTNGNRWSHLASAALVAAAFGVVAVLYDRLRDPVPIHWNIHGVADGFMAKPWGALLLPLVMAGVAVMFWALPRLSPRGYELEPSRRPLAIVQTVTLAFLLLVHGLAMVAATGAPVRFERVIPAAVGVLFIVLGNFLTKFRRNFFVGVRTPWTLASDEVWLRTHRLAARVFVVMGLVLFVAGVSGARLSWLVPAILAAAAVPIVYSYVIYRRLPSAGSGGGG